MHYAPRTIAFSAELLHPPTAPDPAPIQKLHNQMFETGEPLYRSFTVTHQGAVLSNPVTRPGAVSSATFLADRCQFREELTGLTVEEFAARVIEVAEQVAALRQLQLYLQQKITVRTLVNPRSYKDSRTYLGQGMFGFSDELEDFGREPQLFGLRMVFPPKADEANAFTLKIESFHNDPRSLFIENVGGFGPVVAAKGLDPIAGNIASTYDFVVERALAFIARFDLREES